MSGRADFRVIPSIDQLRQRPAANALAREFGDTATTTALRAAAATMRDRIADGVPAPPDTEAASHLIESTAAAQLAAQFRGSLRSAINATGVILHTNLGRAPLARAAVERVSRIAQGYSNLEYDVVAGRRGSRTIHACRPRNRRLGKRRRPDPLAEIFESDVVPLLKAAPGLLTCSNT